MPGPYVYPYPRPALTADLVVFAVVEGEVRVLLIRRKHEPFAGRWALPGGFVDEHEQTLAAAVRELREETGLEVPPEQVDWIGLFDTPGRDPRGWTVGAAYLHIIDGRPPDVAGCDDAEEARWLHPRWLDLPRVGEPPADPPADRLAFDHDAILKKARSLVGRNLISFLRPGLIPEVFTLSDLVRVRDHLGSDSATEVLEAAIAFQLVQGSIEEVDGEPDRYRRLLRSGG